MLISICVPSIRPDTLGDAIVSIRGQSHADWELIVVGQGDELALRAAVADAAAVILASGVSTWIATG